MRRSNFAVIKGYITGKTWKIIRKTTWDGLSKTLFEKDKARNTIMGLILAVAIAFPAVKWREKGRYEKAEPRGNRTRHIRAAETWNCRRHTQRRSKMPLWKRERRRRFFEDLLRQKRRSKKRKKSHKRPGAGVVPCSS